MSEENKLNTINENEIAENQKQKENTVNTSIIEENTKDNYEQTESKEKYEILVEEIPEENTSKQENDNSPTQFSQTTTLPEYHKQEEKKKISHMGTIILVSLLSGIIGGASTFGVLSVTNSNVKQEETASVVSSSPVSDKEVTTYTATSLSELIDNAMPSIVAITCTSQTQVPSFWGLNIEDVESAGSGVIINQDDTYLYIVTNYHVIENSTSILINFDDNSTVNADIKGYNEENDIAVLAIKKTDMSESTLNHISIASVNTEGKEKVGDYVIAIGNALGYGQSVTDGIISALNKTVTSEDGESILTQTNAAINPGNSGGALLNMNGELIGINCAKYSDTDVEGMGFSIPMTTAMPIIEEIINEEYTPAQEKSYIGVAIVTIDEETSKRYGYPEGILIQDIYENSPAIGKLQVGDIVTAVDGKETNTAEELKEIIENCTPGQEISLTIQRYVSKNNYKETIIKLKVSSKMVLSSQTQEQENENEEIYDNSYDSYFYNYFK